MTTEEKVEEKKDRKDNDLDSLDKLLREICEPGCYTSGENMEFDFEIEAIKREKAAETPQGWEWKGRRSSYLQIIKKAVQRVEEYERSLREKNIGETLGKAGSRMMLKMMKLINIYIQVKEKYKIPDLRELLTVEDIKRSMLDMVKVKRGSIGKTVYFKTIVRRIIMYSCVKGLFPVFTISRSGNEIISIRYILSELEGLSRSGKDRRITNICVRGRSCIKRILREVGVELNDDLLKKIALISSEYSGVDFNLVMEALKISFTNDRDEIDVLNDLSSRRIT